MWTYESNDTALATSYGVTGITTNEAAMGRQIRSLLVSDKLTVQVLPSEDRWYGVTYREDKPVVVNAIETMKNRGDYPHILWPEK